MSSKTAMESKLSDLRISLPPQGKPPTTQKGDVIDSWEDDDLAQNTALQSPTEGLSATSLKSPNPELGPPPPTPISAGGQYVDWSDAQVLGGGRPSTRSYAPNPSSTTQTEAERDQRRPEKTTATASRMIAAGLGMKTQKKTEEQKQYDRAIREQETKRREREKQGKEREKEADEKLKAAVWDG